ncbi:ead/Ea22-like family protein [Escherichia coli]|uniref:ead/Ea22-like family protein n=1 Tax=Escherichia coli TaxID=562 RepID=UPI001F100D3A|nr:ead/Ea22-like family protein [Escherichia coli]MCH4635606.1 ead/Ea22-like family protein [Escherichia coli]
MNKIDYQALREAAEKAGEDKWQAKKINGDFFVIRHGSYTRQHGYTSYQPIAEIDCKPVRDFVAKANPATVLELLDELEAAKKRIAELVAELVSQTYKLPTLSSNEVNDAAWKLHDMLTEHGPLNGRQFNNLKGCFYEALKVAMRNSPVTPSVWMSCSERMPDDAQWCVVEAADGYYVQCWSEGQGWLGDDISLRNCDVIRWMSIPEPPQQDGE